MRKIPVLQNTDTEWVMYEALNITKKIFETLVAVFLHINMIRYYIVLHKYCIGS